MYDCLRAVGCLRTVVGRNASGIPYNTLWMFMAFVVAFVVALRVPVRFTIATSIPIYYLKGGKKWKIHEQWCK